MTRVSIARCLTLRGPFDRVMLSVPYRSQEDPDARRFRNDCGPACIAMILEWAGKGVIPINTLSSETNLITSDVGLTCAADAALLDRNGVPATAKTHVTLAAILADIEAGRPVIALVNYGAIAHRLNKADTSGHFMLVIGFDAENVYVHDPDYYGSLRSEGAGLAIPRAEFATALATSPAPNSAIFLA